MKEMHIGVPVLSTYSIFKLSNYLILHAVYVQAIF